VATVDLKCRPDLPHVASHARNAEYNPRRFSAVIMRLREPSKATALLFGTGKLCVTGVKNEDDAKFAARKIAKIVLKLGFSAGFEDFKIQNMVASGDLGFPVRLEGIADEHSKFSSYEPELFPGLIYRVESPRVVLLVFVSGKICVTGAKSRSQLLDAVQKLYPVLYKVRGRACLGGRASCRLSVAAPAPRAAQPARPPTPAASAPARPARAVQEEPVGGPGRLCVGVGGADVERGARRRRAGVGGGCGGVVGGGGGRQRRGRRRRRRRRRRRGRLRLRPTAAGQR